MSYVFHISELFCEKIGIQRKHVASAFANHDRQMDKQWKMNPTWSFASLGPQ